MRLMKPMLVAFLGAICGMTGLSALAAGEQAAPAFEEIDQNQDGAVTETEAQGSWLAGAFTQVDQNGDGLISKSEYEKATG